jgi:hypothetical protein
MRDKRRTREARFGRRDGRRWLEIDRDLQLCIASQGLGLRIRDVVLLTLERGPCSAYTYPKNVQPEFVHCGIA